MGSAAAGRASIALEDAEVGIVSTGGPATNTQLSAHVSEQASAMQVAGDQIIHRHVLPEAALRPVTEVAATRKPRFGSSPRGRSSCARRLLHRVRARVLDVETYRGLVVDEIAPVINGPRPAGDGTPR